jgi:hypothetical protein
MAKSKCQMNGNAQNPKFIKFRFNTNALKKVSLRGVKRRSLAPSKARELFRLPRASPSQRLRRIATLPLVAHKDVVKRINAFVSVWYLNFDI